MAIKKCFLFSSFLTAALCVIVLITLNFRINLTGSMPRGFYREMKAPLKIGTLVEVCLPEKIALFGLARHYLSPGNCPGHVEPVLKEIAGLAGDEIELTEDYVAVNSKKLQHSATLKRDEGNRTMPIIARGRYLLTGNQAWLVGTRDAKSWDSRYYGPIDQRFIKSTIQPIFVW